MKSSGEGGHQIPQQQGTCPGVKETLKTRNLERRSGLTNTNCRNTVNMQEKKVFQCMKTGCDREKVS